MLLLSSGQRKHYVKCYKKLKKSLKYISVNWSKTLYIENWPCTKRTSHYASQEPALYKTYLTLRFTRAGLVQNVPHTTPHENWSCTKRTSHYASRELVLYKTYLTLRLILSVQRLNMNLCDKDNSVFEKYEINCLSSTIRILSPLSSIS
jgi:hypothetical protein